MKRALKICILLFCIAGAAAVGLVFLNYIRFDFNFFSEKSRSLLERSRLLAEKAQKFNQEKALGSFGENGQNGFCFRFDRYYRRGEWIGPEPERSKIIFREESLYLDFNADDPVILRPKKGKFRIEDGVLRAVFPYNDYLLHEEELSLDKDKIGVIEIRARVKKGTKMELAWSPENLDDWVQQKLGSVNINLIPDGKFHVYRINAENALRKYLNPGDTIKKIFLRYSNKYRDTVDIDFIRFLSRKEAFSENPVGQTYPVKEKEMRSALYALCPGEISYKIRVPDDPTFLRFGLGILEPEVPIRFSVFISEDGEKEKIFSREIDTAENWHDFDPIELDRWKSREVEIIFQAESRQPAVAFWSNPLLYQRPRKKFNILIILEDALRSDHLSSAGYARKTSPFKKELFSRGLIFKNAFSQATKTRPSCPALMTSLYPTATGVWNFQEMLDEKYLTLAEILRNQGFVTAAFIQNGAAGAMAGLNQGYSYFFNKEAIGLKPGPVYRRRVPGWIGKNRGRNFFVYVHLIDPHGPYSPPPRFRNWYLSNKGKGSKAAPDSSLDPEWARPVTDRGRIALYDGEIRNNDLCLEGLISYLESEDLLDETLIFFISDHGEFMGEHGLWEHHPPGYRAGIQVPLMVHCPSLFPEGRQFSEPVQLIDIMPTILELSGIDNGELLLQGDSLLELIEERNPEKWKNRLCLSEEVYNRRARGNREYYGSIFWGDHHLLYSKALDSEELNYGEISDPPWDLMGKMRIFNYIRDPDEGNYRNLFQYDLFFKNRVYGFLASFQKTNLRIWRSLIREESGVVQSDPKVNEQLRALGYIP